MSVKKTVEIFVDEIAAEIKRRGLPESEPIEQDAKYAFPKDITRLTDKKLGKLQSYWAAFLGYALEQLAQNDVALTLIKNEYDRIWKHWFFKLDPGDKSELKDSIESRVLKIKEVAEWRELSIKEEALNVALRSEVDKMKSYLMAISREQSRRKEEYERTK